MSSATKQIMILIPLYNSVETIVQVINRIPKSVITAVSKVVVIDNNSNDGSFEKVTEYKKQNKLTYLEILKNETNLLFGGNIKAGCSYGITNNMDIIAVLHADGQYPSDQILELISPIQKGEAQAVSGSRILGNPRKGGMPIWRLFGNRFLTIFENFFVGKKLSEWHSGFRAYDLNVMKTLNYLDCVNGYEWTTDILLLYHTNGYTIKEIAIPTHYGTESTSPSKIRTFTYFVNSFKLAFLYFLHRKGIRKNKKYLVS